MKIYQIWYSRIKKGNAESFCSGKAVSDTVLVPVKRVVMKKECDGHGIYNH